MKLLMVPAELSLWLTMIMILFYATYEHIWEPQPYVTY